MASVFTIDRLEAIFERTNGICHRRAAWKNYGKVGAQGGWEVDHSVPRALGGTDRLSNLLPAHIRCNRSKQAASSCSARGQYGKRRAPLSARRRREKRVGNGLVGAGLGWTLAMLFVPQLRIAGLIVGAVTGLSSDPDE